MATKKETAQAHQDDLDRKESARQHAKEKRPTTLIGALVAAQAAARPVEKDARNVFHKYNYVSAEAMIADAKEILAAHDLGFIPSSFSIVASDGIAMADGKDRTREYGAAGMLLSEWALVHGPSDETMTVRSTWPIVPEAGRPLDKAVAAARTASLSYLLRDLLQLPRVEEGTGLDDDRRDGHRERQKKGAPEFARTKPEAAESDPRPTSAATARSTSPPATSGTTKARPVADGKAAPASPTTPANDRTTTTSSEADSRATTATSDAAVAHPGAKKSATAVLLDFKRSVDAAKGETEVQAIMGRWATALSALPARADAIAQGYARARCAELAGGQAVQRDAEMATQLNEMAKS